MGIKTRLTSNLDQVLKNKEEALNIAFEMIGLQGEAYAKSELTRQGAVDTGRLRSSISHEVLDDGVIIGTNTEYAA